MNETPDGHDGPERALGLIQGPLAAYCTANVIGKGNKDVETDYLAHVVQCENGGAPYESLRAQAVTARSYLYYKLNTAGKIADGQSDQVYSCGATPSKAHYDAVSSTAGQVLRYKGTQVAAFFVAGAKPSASSCVAKGGDSDATNTEKYVTYNWNKSGSGIEQTILGWVNAGNHANRGCMSQWGSRCLANAGWGYKDIIKFYYGMDIEFVHAEGSCTSSCECTAGKVETQACGKCGQKKRTCGGDCKWNAWSGCDSQGPCTPGDAQTEACGSKCGHHQRKCTSQCEWGSWGACQGEGPCAPGQVDSQGCGKCGHHERSCSGKCLWLEFGACQGEGPCAAGQTDVAPCGECGYKERACSPQCVWGLYDKCVWLDPDGGTKACSTTLEGQCGPGFLKCLAGTVGCVGSQKATDEVCDGVDNDCDGEIDGTVGKSAVPSSMGTSPPPYAALVEAVAPLEPMPAGTDTSVVLRFRNVGQKPWPKGLVVVRAEGWKVGEPSKLRHPDWPGLDTAGIVQADIAPGDTAVLTVVLRAPDVPGVVNETFRLVSTSDPSAFVCPIPTAPVSLTVTEAPPPPPPSPEGEDAGPSREPRHVPDLDALDRQPPDGVSVTHESDASAMSETGSLVTGSRSSGCGGPVGSPRAAWIVLVGALIAIWRRRGPA